MSNQFYIDKLTPLVGGKIIATISDKEGEFFGLLIKPEKGKARALWLLSDDEGNGPGSFELSP